MPTFKPDETLGSRLFNLRKARRLTRERFFAGRMAEKQYARALRKIADQVDAIVRGMAPDGVVANVGTLVQTLNRYADILHPWAESTAERMIRDVMRRDANAWQQHSRAIGQSLRREIEQAPTGQAFQKAIAQQIEEITSIPRKAATRLYELTTEALTTGKRADVIAQQILASGEVSLSQAKMLARTGVSSTATAITKVRAEYIGSTQYIWRTSKDGAVRESHRKMEGKVVDWSNPPTLDGYTAHCGEFANCRCYPEVIVPDKQMMG